MIPIDRIENYRAKRIHVFENGNCTYGRTLCVNPSNLPTWNTVLNHVTEILHPKFGAVLHLRTVDGSKSVHSFTDLTSNTRYVACGKNQFIYIDGGYRTKSQHDIKPKPCFQHYPNEIYSDDLENKKWALEQARKNGRMVIYVFANGVKRQYPTKFVFTKRDMSNWHTTLAHMATRMDMPGGIYFLHTLYGERVCGPFELQHGACYVGVSHGQRFQNLDYMNIYDEYIFRKKKSGEVVNHFEIGALSGPICFVREINSYCYHEKKVKRDPSGDRNTSSKTKQYDRNEQWDQTLRADENNENTTPSNNPSQNIIVKSKPIIKFYQPGQTKSNPISLNKVKDETEENSEKKITQSKQDNVKFLNKVENETEENFEKKISQTKHKYVKSLNKDKTEQTSENEVSQATTQSQVKNENKETLTDAQTKCDKESITEDKTASHDLKDQQASKTSSSKSTKSSNASNLSKENSKQTSKNKTKKKPSVDQSIKSSGNKLVTDILNKILNNEKDTTASPDPANKKLNNEEDATTSLDPSNRKLNNEEDVPTSLDPSNKKLNNEEDLVVCNCKQLTVVGTLCLESLNKKPKNEEDSVVSNYNQSTVTGTISLDPPDEENITANVIAISSNDLSKLEEGEEYHKPNPMALVNKDKLAAPYSMTSAPQSMKSKSNYSNGQIDVYPSLFISPTTPENSLDSVILNNQIAPPNKSDPTTLFSSVTVEACGIKPLVDRTLGTANQETQTKN